MQSKSNKALTHRISKLVYIIPTYNEIENIVKMLLEVEKIFLDLPNYHSSILVVDDKSPDGTGKFVEAFSKKHRNVYLLSGNKNGLGSAMIRGYKFAMNEMKADIIVSNEADFSYNPKVMLDMIKKIEEGFDVVFGSRKLSNINKWPLTRQIIHYIANTIFAKVVAGVDQIEDHNSAFKAIRVKNVLDKISFKNFPNGFSFFNYFAYKITTINPNIYELKTNFKPRTRGVSKMAIKDSLEYIINCMQIRFEKITLHSKS